MVETQRTGWGSILKLKIILWCPPEQHGRRQGCSQRLHKPVLALMTLLSRTRLLLTHCKKVSDERLQLPLARGVRALDHVRRKKQGHVGTRAFYCSTVHFGQMHQGKKKSQLDKKGRRKKVFDRQSINEKKNNQVNQSMFLANGVLMYIIRNINKSIMSYHTCVSMEEPGVGEGSML